MPEWIVISPEGDVTRDDGQQAFRIDAPAVDEIKAHFKRRGVKLLIDYEHQSLGGKFASPTGKAETAGWIDELRYRPGVGTDRSRAGHGPGCAPTPLGSGSPRQQVGVQYVLLP